MLIESKRTAYFKTLQQSLKFTQTEGNDFISSGKALAMKVPSSVVKGDYNYLINPRHEKADKIKVVSCEEFKLDMRLFK